MDFTTPLSSVSVVDTAANAGIAYIVGTTGFADEELDSLREAIEQVPVLKPANFVLGVEALFALVEDLAKMLPNYDIEVAETHHNWKQNALSGTVWSALERIEKSRWEITPVYGRSEESSR